MMKSRFAMPQLRPACVKAFTLIELLVVIAIIAILAAILFPVFAQAREKARQAACLSNDKQMATSIIMYTQDYDEALPFTSYANTFNFMDSAAGPAGSPTNPPSTLPAPVAGGPNNFMAVVQPYLKNTGVLVCPSSEENNPPLAGTAYPCTPSSCTSYYGNGVVLPAYRNISSVVDPNYQSIALSDIASPASIIFLHENFERTNCARTFPRYNATVSKAFDRWHAYGTQPDGRVMESFSNKHGGGGNLIYCDGHAKWSKYTNIRSRDFGLTPDQGWTMTNSINPDGGGTWQRKLDY